MGQFMLLSIVGRDIWNVVAFEKKEINVTVLVKMAF